MAEVLRRQIMFSTRAGNYKVRIPATAKVEMYGSDSIEIRTAEGELIGMFGGITAFRDFALVSSELT